MFQVSSIILILAISVPLRARGDDPYYYQSYQGTTKCYPIGPLRYPKSIPEVQDIVRDAALKKLRVKAVGSLHSINPITCTDGIGMSLKYINHSKVIDESTTLFGAGLELHQALKVLEKEGRTFVTTPLYGGISLGGGTGTGAHSSSLNHPASLSDQIVGLTVVDGNGELQNLEGELALRPYRVHLGLLGIIVEVVMRTVPLKKMRVDNKVHDDKVLLDGTALKWANDHDFFQLWWFPNIQDVVVSKGDFLEPSTPGNAKTNLMMTVKDPLLAYGTGTTYEVLQSLRRKESLLQLENSTRDWLSSEISGIPPVYEDEGGKFVNPAVGYSTNLMTSTCPQGSCWWDNPYMTIPGMEFSFAFELSKFEGVIGMVKDVLKFYPASFYQFGLFIRFAGPSNSSLGLSYGKPVFTIEWVVHFRWNNPENAPDGLGTYQLLIQKMIKEYSGRPHWGKNTEYSFSSIQKHYPDLPNFVARMKEVDPHGIFHNEFATKILLGQGDSNIVRSKPRCGVNFECICEKDEKCGWGQGCNQVGEYLVCIDKDLGCSWTSVGIGITLLYGVWRFSSAYLRG